MKKTALILVFIFSILAAKAQEGVVITAYENLITDSLLTVKGEVFNLDTTNISDGQILIRVLGVWKNSTSSGGFDSLTYSLTTGYLYDWRGGSKYDSILFDGRYLELTDTVDYVQYSDSTITFTTPTQVKDSLDLIRASMQTSQTVYPIVLPAGSSVALRIATPTSLPDGWVLTDDGIDLIITHNLGRWSADVTVKANMSGTIWQQQINTAKYSYYSDISDNVIRIYGLCTATKPIRINIIME